MKLIDIEIKISKDEYELLCKTPYAEVQKYGKEIQNKSEYPSNKYGYYGCVFSEKKDGYFLTYTRTKERITDYEN